MVERRDKLRALRAALAESGSGAVAFPNDFKPRHQAADVYAQHGETDAQTLDSQPVTVSVAGRMMLKRVMGKASFATVQDGSLGDTGGRIQLYITRDAVDEDVYSAFKHWDLGDIIGAEGTVFRTRTGELSIKVTQLRLLTKSLRPMPDKFHGIADQEVKYRQRYVDLMTDEDARRRFVARSKAVSSLRDFMVQHGFLEVETPMLHPIPGAPTPSRSPRTTTRWTRKCFCALRPSCTSSACWWAASSGCLRSTATSATKASRCATTPSSR